jgi:ATP-dependent DNA helicase RecQ
VRDEVVNRLGMCEPKVLVHGFDRPNIRLAVRGFAEEDDKREALLATVESAPKPGIVYAATRKRAEEIGAALAERGIAAGVYHAGMTAAERSRVQDAFMNDETDVIVATTAFGMGVDKPNVRFVHHLDVSESVDSYYQEIGRAGRDGEPAEAVLFFRSEDLGLRRFFAAGGQVDAAQMALVAEVVQDAGGPVDVAEIREEVDLSQSRALAAVNRLEEVGAVELLATGHIVAATDADVAAAVEAAADAQEHRRKFAESRLEMMRGYADMTGCRREYILNYFGEAYAPPCRACDRCEAGLVQAVPDDDRPFPIDSHVEHAAWGPGRVMRYAGETMVVLFDTVGYRTLAVEVVLENGLITLAA